MTAHVTIVGNLVRDPELRFTPSGQATANFGVAVNRRTKQDGEWADAEPSFFNVTCWRELAENVSESLRKGTRVVVTGRLEQRSWEQDGQKRSTVEVVADEVAPSLRWATAQVIRADGKERTKGDDHRTLHVTRASEIKPQAPAGDYSEEPF